MDEWPGSRPDLPELALNEYKCFDEILNSNSTATQGLSNPSLFIRDLILMS